MMSSISKQMLEITEDDLLRKAIDDFTNKMKNILALWYKVIS